MLAPRLVVALALLVLALPSLTSGAAPSAPVFSPAVAVGAHVGEPGLRLAPSGDIFVHYPGGLYRSSDGGASFSKVVLTGSTIFGGDADLAVLKDGTLLYADLSGITISVARSTNTTGSGPWAQNLLASEEALVDRQWIESGPDPTTGLEATYLVFNGPHGLRALKSLTGGLVFEGVLDTPVSTATTCSRGNVAVSADGTVYIASCSSLGPEVRISRDGGLTWSRIIVSARPHLDYEGQIFPIVTTDAANDAYLAWAEVKNGATTDVMMAGSRDHGATWTAPLRLTNATSAGVMPWAVGGSGGRVGIVWYASDMQGHVDAMPSSASWHVEYAVVGDLFGPAPLVAQAPLNGDVIQRGSICTHGTGCSNGDRNLLDFIQVRADASGRALVSYTDGCDPCTSPSNSRASHVMFARQTDGPGLFG